ncbi:DUF2268 domain-containing putative Zn-dependent protease [Aestuariivirga sp.]|jgi:hypothetical protein|uniref:DUF2268 domain-containing putative Zn-dependent protease n=1 Tax=Aestuariivirga sp. TaxID=2650926 RepID=UPI003782E3E8
MPSWILHLVNARGQLASCADVILSACAEAEARVGAVTAPLALDIVIRATEAMPEALFVSGHCYEPAVIGIGIDLTQPHTEERLRHELLKSLFHEFHHALRWDGPGYGDTLGEALVSEGLAQRFLHEMMNCPPEPSEVAVPDDVCEAWRGEALAGFDDAAYDHAAWFFGTGDMPNWLGYTLGRRIVDRYLQSHPQATALSLAHMEAVVFRAMLEEE